VKAEPYIIHTLKMMGDLVENILNEVTQTKKVKAENKGKKDAIPTPDLTVLLW
jgi:hypothetical protein